MAEKVEGLLSWQRMKRDEEELGLQIRGAMFMVFLVEFLEFMVVLLAPSICSCCSRGVEEEGVEKLGVGLWRRKVRDGDGWSGCGCVCAVERLGRGVLRASSFIAIFGCLCCGVVVGSWWRQQLFCFFRFSCLLVPWQPLSAVGFFLAPQDELLHSWWLGLWFELL